MLSYISTIVVERSACLLARANVKYKFELETKAHSSYVSKLQNICFFFVSTFIAINKECIFERKFLNFLKNKTDAMYV